MNLNLSGGQNKKSCLKDLQCQRCYQGAIMLMQEHIISDDFGWPLSYPWAVCSSPSWNQQNPRRISLCYLLNGLNLISFTKQQASLLMESSKSHFHILVGNPLSFCLQKLKSKTSKQAELRKAYTVVQENLESCPCDMWLFKII